MVKVLGAYKRHAVQDSAAPIALPQVPPTPPWWAEQPQGMCISAVVPSLQGGSRDPFSQKPGC